jgi:hypothetical protein
MLGTHSTTELLPQLIFLVFERRILHELFLTGENPNLNPPNLCIVSWQNNGHEEERVLSAKASGI